MNQIENIETLYSNAQHPTLKKYWLAILLRMRDRSLTWRQIALQSELKHPTPLRVWDAYQDGGSKKVAELIASGLLQTASIPVFRQFLFSSEKLKRNCLDRLSSVLLEGNNLSLDRVAPLIQDLMPYLATDLSAIAKLRQSSDVQKQIGAKIRFYRESVKITQAALSKAIGISDQVLSKLEKGQTRIDFEIILLVAIALDKSIYDFVPSGWIQLKGDSEPLILSPTLKTE